MLDLNEISNVTEVITHAFCADGIASGMIAKDVLPNAEIRFMSHQTAALHKLPARPGQLFVDFVPPRERAQEFVDAGAIVLDHHRGSEDIVRMFGDRGIFADEEKEPGVSGALLAFRHVWKPLAEVGMKTIIRQQLIEDFATLAGIRDTWQMESPLWMAARNQTDVLHFFAQEEWIETLFGPVFHERMRLGPRLTEKFDERVKGSLKEAYWFDTHGLRFVIITGVSTTSDAMNLVRDKADVVIGFLYRLEAPFIHGSGDGAGPKLQLSIRSRGKFNCQAFATVHGGTGHERSAGCKLSVGHYAANPYAHIMAVVENHFRLGAPRRAD